MTFLIHSLKRHKAKNDQRLLLSWRPQVENSPLYTRAQNSNALSPLAGEKSHAQQFIARTHKNSLDGDRIFFAKHQKSSHGSVRETETDFRNRIHSTVGKYVIRTHLPQDIFTTAHHICAGKYVWMTYLPTKRGGPGFVYIYFIFVCFISFPLGN